MRIGIEARILSNPVTGMARFLLAILRELHAADDGNEYFLYSHKPFILPFDNKKTWHTRVHPGAGQWNGSWWLVRTLPRMIAKDSIDVFWGPSHVLPPVKEGGMKKIVTIHDLTYAHCPQTMLWYSRTVSRLLVPRAINAADMVVSVSAHIGQEVRERFGLIADRVRVIPEGVDRGVFKKTGGPSSDAPYIIHVGTLEPRKRIHLILDAYAIFRLAHPEMKLILAGGSGWKSGAVRKRLQEAGVEYLGYVPDDQLPGLYSGASATVFASEYEGCGLPLLEAAACGTPVVVPDLPWARETGGEGAYFFKDKDTRDMAKVLWKACEDKTPRLIDVEGYSWTKAAEEYLKIFRELYEYE